MYDVHIFLFMFCHPPFSVCEIAISLLFVLKFSASYHSISQTSWGGSYMEALSPILDGEQERSEVSNVWVDFGILVLRTYHAEWQQERTPFFSPSLSYAIAWKAASEWVAITIPGDAVHWTRAQQQPELSWLSRQKQAAAAASSMNTCGQRLFCHNFNRVSNTKLQDTAKKVHVIDM